MKLVVAGGTGFLGFHICRAAVVAGHHVVSLSKSPPIPDRTVSQVDYLCCDMSRKAPDLNFRPDVIINAAGYVVHPPDEASEDVLRSAHLSIAANLLSIRGAADARFIHLGSGDEYLLGGRMVTESTPSGGLSGYGRVKTATSEMVMLRAHEAGYDPTVLRLFLVFGPAQDVNRLIPQLILGLARSERVPMSNGTQIRDFLFADDFARAVMAVIGENETREGILNVSSGIGVPVVELARRVQAIVGRGELGIGDFQEVRAQLPELVGDHQAITSLTGWRPSTSLSEGLALTVDWFLRTAH